jgi:hypothetical protein
MRRRTGKWPEGDPVLHPVLTHFLLKAADFITVHRAGKQFPECVPASACPQGFQQGWQGGCMRNLHKIRSKVSDGPNQSLLDCAILVATAIFIARISFCFGMQK